MTYQIILTPTDPGRYQSPAPIITDADLLPLSIPAFMAQRRAWYNRQFEGKVARRVVDVGDPVWLDGAMWEWYLEGVGL